VKHSYKCYNQFHFR